MPCAQSSDPFWHVLTIRATVQQISHCLMLPKIRVAALDLRRGPQIVRPFPDEVKDFGKTFWAVEQLKDNHVPSGLYDFTQGLPCINKYSTQVPGSIWFQASRPFDQTF